MIKTRIYLFLFIIFLNCFNLTASANITDIKSMLEGRYELVYWKQDNLEFNYPEIAGTLVVKDNKISFTLDNNIKKMKL